MLSILSFQIQYSLDQTISVLDIIISKDIYFRRSYGSSMRNTIVMKSVTPIESSFVDVSPLTPIEEMTNAGKKRKKSPKEGKKRNDKSSSRRISSKKSIADEISPLITGKVSLAPPDTEREPVYDFVGYDLERLRVQVTNRKKTFYSADDTLVQVEIDDWLYKTKNLRITVTLHGYSLRLFHRIDGPETNEILHVTSRIGIILAFQKKLASSRKSQIF